MKSAMLTATILFSLPALAGGAPATPAPPAKDQPGSVGQDPYTAFTRVAYGMVKNIILKTAEKMPEEDYNFKPTESVRSFGQILGHIADAEYLFGAQVLGVKNPNLDIENTRTTKADLIAALKDAFAFCDKAYVGMTDASGGQTVKFMGGDTPKLGVLTANNMHTMEHYGNLATYLRMKNLVPPTSEPGFYGQPKH